MTIKSFKTSHFGYYVLASTVVAIVLCSLLMLSTKQEILNNFIGMEFMIEADSNIDAELYFTYDSEFNSINKIKPILTNKGSLYFVFPKNPKLIKKFRLDFGDDSKEIKIKIKQLKLIFKKRIIIFEEKELFENIFLNSASVHLDKAHNKIITKPGAQIFDPYIIFASIGQLVLSSNIFIILLLLPFILFIGFYFIVNRKKYRFTVLQFLVLLFILCIPLKIAWTTFCTILLCIYALFEIYNKRKINLKNKEFLFFVTIFCIIVFIGRPIDLGNINKQISLLLFALLSISEIFSRAKNHMLIYTFFFMVFNAIIVAAGINFLIWFREFYGLGILDYFNEIKTFSGNVREWLYYDHAAFLSFFGLVGLLFANYFYENRKISKSNYIIYSILLLLFIIIVGARICLLVYVIYQINFIAKLELKAKTILNGIMFSGTALFLFTFISKIDIYRHYLWMISWEAIKEKPLLGSGMGSSNNFLNDSRLINNAGFFRQFDFNHSHNQFLTLMMEVGLIGTILTLGSLIWFLHKTKQYRNQILTLFLFGIFYIFLTESILQTSKPLYVICFLFLYIVQGNFNSGKKHSA